MMLLLGMWQELTTSVTASFKDPFELLQCQNGQLEIHIKFEEHLKHIGGLHKKAVKLQDQHVQSVRMIDSCW